MNRHVLSILVENHAGVLSRITGLFSRRGYNIDSVSVGITEDLQFSRITIAVNCDDTIIEQIIKQVKKLIDVIKIKQLEPSDSVYRELALIKVNADTNIRPDIISIVDIFRGNIIDVSNESLMIEITGDQSKIEAFTKLMEPYGIKELARTGLTALERGNCAIKEQ